MAVNVKGTWLCAPACMPVMRAAGGGRDRQRRVDHRAQRLGRVRALRRVQGRGHRAHPRRWPARSGPLGIRVNAIAPGFTLTDASRELFADEGVDPETYALDRGSLKRPAQPEDVVGAALWLAGEGAGYVTGQTIVVDGGRIFV